METKRIRWQKKTFKKNRFDALHFMYSIVLRERKLDPTIFSCQIFCLAKVPNAECSPIKSASANGLNGSSDPRVLGNEPPTSR